MKTPTTKAEAMNEAKQAKERATLCEKFAAEKKRPKTQRAELAALAKTNHAQHARFLALAATLPE